MAKATHKPLKARPKKAKLRPTFIRQYREKRGWTLDELGEKVGMTSGNLSEIENGNTGYRQVTLEALAAALGCTPADLLVRDPNDPEGLWSLIERAQPAQRKQMAGIFKAFLDGLAE